MVGKVVHRVVQDVVAFANGRDLVIFAVGVALSNALQGAVNSVITNMVMPFVSYGTGATNLASRNISLLDPDDKAGTPGIKLNWGMAINSIITFVITTIVMVQFARFVTTRYVKSSTIQWTP